LVVIRLRQGFKSSANDRFLGIITAATEYLVDVLSNLKDLVISIDYDFKITYVNQAQQAALGFSKEKIVGNCLWEIMPKTIGTIMEKKLKEVLATKQITSFQWVGVYSGRNLESTLYPSSIGVTIVGVDITERKKAEDNLEQSMRNYQELLRQSNAQKEELETIFDSLPSQGWYKDKDDRILKVNKSFADYMNMSKKDLEGKPLCNFFPPEIVQKCREDDKEVIETGQPKKGILDRYETVNGVYWFLTEKVPYKDRDGNVIGTISFSTDITNLKKLEGQLQEQERLATIGQTAGMVGHDIRNPLQAIVSDVYLLKDFLNAMPEMPIKNDVAESLKSIEQNIGYINKIVADLQDYSRKLRPDYANVDLSEVMTNVVKDLRVSEDVKVNVNSNTFEKIRTEPTYIRRILTNLVNNAIQAMPNGGYLELTSIVKEDKLFFIVADTGVGIPEDVKPKLFSPMMTTKAKGQGLGLAVVKRLVEALDGTINLESQEGKGTKFIIELPISK
jgi:PAS domain S-box-containing protein